MLSREFSREPSLALGAKRSVRVGDCYYSARMHSSGSRPQKTCLQTDASRLARSLAKEIISRTIVLVHRRGRLILARTHNSCTEMDKEKEADRK